MWWYVCPECFVKWNRGLSKLTITTVKTLKLHTNGPLLRYPTQRDINVKNVSMSCRHENIRYPTKNTYHGMVCTVLCIIGQQPQVTWATDSSLNTDPNRKWKIGWLNFLNPPGSCIRHTLFEMSHFVYRKQWVSIDAIYCSSPYNYSNMLASILNIVTPKRLVRVVSTYISL